MFAKHLKSNLKLKNNTETLIKSVKYSENSKFKI